MRQDQFIGGQLQYFIAEVESISDPEKLGRVQCRAVGWHTDNTNILKTGDLPWATVVLPTTSASYKGVGSTHELEVGSYVFGLFRDGTSAQDMLVLGSISTRTDQTPDIPSLARLAPSYPNNKVHRTNAGHTVEYDNTVGSERIQITHKDNHILRMTGSEMEFIHKSGTIIEILEDGTIKMNSSNNTIQMVGNTSITGTLNVSGAQTNNSTLTVEGNQTNNGTLNVSGNITSGGSITDSDGDGGA